MLETEAVLKDRVPAIDPAGAAPEEQLHAEDDVVYGVSVGEESKASSLWVHAIRASLGR